MNFKFNSYNKMLLCWYLARYTFLGSWKWPIWHFLSEKSFEKPRLFCGSSKRVWKPNIGSNYAPATWLHGARLQPPACTAPTLARLDKLEKSSTSSIPLKPPWCKTISNSANVLTFYVNIVINMFFIHVSLAGENPAGLQTNGAPGLHQLCFGPTNPSLGLLFSFLWASLQIIFVSRWRFQ